MLGRVSQDFLATGANIIIPPPTKFELFLPVHAVGELHGFATACQRNLLASNMQKIKDVRNGNKKKRPQALCVPMHLMATHNGTEDFPISGRLRPTQPSAHRLPNTPSPAENLSQECLHCERGREEEREGELGKQKGLACGLRCLTLLERRLNVGEWLVNISTTADRDAVRCDGK